MKKVVRIERISPRKGGSEEPHHTGKGYQLADPKHGNEKHHTINALYARTLDEAAEMIDQGYHIWMTQKGKRPSLIKPSSVRIVRA